MKNWEAIVGDSAQYSEYHPGEIVHFPVGPRRDEIQAGKVLHVSNGLYGQFYIVENDQTNWPDIILANELTVL